MLREAGVVGDLSLVAAVAVDDEDPRLGIAECDLAAVGGEHGAVQPGRGIAGHARRGGVPQVVGDVDLLFTAGIGNPGDAVAFRRPCDLALVGVRAVRQVAGHAVLDGHREHLAPRGDHHAFTVRADVEGFEMLCDLHQFAEFEAGVCRHGDRERTVVTGPHVQDVQGAVQFVHDTVRTVIACPAHVATLVTRQLARLSAGIVEGVDVQVVVAVRDEKDARLHPHRVTIGARVLRYIPGTGAVEFEYEQVLGPAPFVALPGAEVAEQGREQDTFAVGREHARPRDDHGQRFGQAARQPDRVQARIRQAGSLPQ